MTNGAAGGFPDLLLGIEVWRSDGQPDKLQARIGR